MKPIELWHGDCLELMKNIEEADRMQDMTTEGQEEVE